MRAFPGRQRQNTRKDLDADDKRDDHKDEENKRKVPEKTLRVEQHADGEEKDTGEHITERDDVAQCIDVVVGFADDKPRNEGPQGKGKPRLAGEPGHDDADTCNGDEEELAAFLEGDPVQEYRDNPAGENDDHEQDAGNFCDLEGEGIEVRATASHEYRGDEDHGDDGQVLEERIPSSVRP